jgi:hypothetical protein
MNLLPTGSRATLKKPVIVNGPIKKLKFSINLPIE